MKSYKTLYSKEQIAEKIDSIASRIASDLSDTEAETTLMVGLLKGSVVFLSDLMRALYKRGICPEIDFMIVSSYKSSTSPSQTIEIIQDINIPVEGRTVLLVDDIVDTGMTLDQIIRLLEEKNPAKILTCALLDKPSRRKVDIKPDYVGFEIDNIFVVGYGLDMAEKFRCLPYIAALKG